MSNRRAWRAQVLDLYGTVCAAADSTCEGRLEAHHLHYRSQGGQDDAANGLPLCTRHHTQVHQRWLKVRPEWLLQETRDYLARQGVVCWDEDGRPFGRHFRGFAVVASW